MTSWKTSEIARRLAERDDAEPPEGLLEKIKQDIPPELPALPLAPEIPEAVPEITGRPRPSRHRVWLMAASLAAAVLGGVLAVRTMETMQSTPPREAAQEKTTEAARQQQPAQGVSPARPTPAPFLPPPPPPPPLALHREALQAPAAPPAADKKRKALDELSGGNVQPAPVPETLPASPAKPAAPRDERASAKAERQTEGQAGGVAGGRISTGATVSNEELEKIPAARDPWAVLQKTPGVLTDRINVGGNESGQQSSYAGPDTAAAPEPPPSVLGETPLLDEKRTDKPASRLGADPEELVRRFSFDDEPPKDGDAAIRAEGIPVPFAPGGYRILRFTAGDARAQVDFNPEAVSSWRRLGSESGAGNNFAALYEVKLKPHVAESQAVATLHLPETTRELRIADLAATWDAASPGLRLASLAAELAEVLHGTPRAKGVDLDDLVRRARKVAADLAGSPRERDAADFLRLAEETARGKKPQG
jgi:hypothetical protein